MARTSQDLLAASRRPTRRQPGPRRGAQARRPRGRRVDNVRVAPLASGRAGVTRAAVEREALGERPTLRVKFLDGDPEVQAKVAAIAKEWEHVANLTLRLRHVGAAEIRISFADEGLLVVDGRHRRAHRAARPRPTMNYGWLEPTTALREYQRVVRHEFGHALGMIHEHQNPAAQGQIPWDKPKVYAYYAQQGWSHGRRRLQHLQVYAEDTTNFTTFDPTSIMEYAIPDSLTDRLVRDRLEHRAVADRTRDFMRRQYPKASPGDGRAGGRRRPGRSRPGRRRRGRHLPLRRSPTAATYIMTTTGADRHAC